MANFTKKAIIQAFEEMLKEKSFGKITVSALVKRCGISSNTFYYHFNNIYDLLETWFEEKKDLFIASATPDDTWVSLLKQFLTALKNNPQIVYHISNDISREQIEFYVFVSVKKYFYETFEKLLPTDQLNKNLITGLAELSCYCFIGIVMDFIWGRMKGDIDTIVNRMSWIVDAIQEYAVKHPERFLNSNENSMLPEEGFS